MKDTLLLQVSKKLGLDGAVAFALLNPSWQVLAGPITILLIARLFSVEMQGYYYTFYSLIAAQSFVELGFYLVILNAASHEWTHLGVDASGHLTGDPRAMSRLISLGRLIAKWYAVASAVFVIGIGTAGYLFFSHDATYGVNWQLPWILFVLVNGLLLWTLPFTSFLEGCNQVRTVNQLRLAQTVLGTIAFWATMTVGAGLWSLVAMSVVRLGCDIYLLLGRYRSFFQPFYKAPTGPAMSWKDEIWPMQWRLAISGIAGFFSSSFFTPVMFHYQGALVAGQMGMTLQIVRVIQTFALPWVNTKAAQFGMLISRREYGALDRLWTRALVVSLSAITLAATGAWAVICLAVWLNLPIANRLLGPLPTGLFLVAAVLMQISQCQSIYLRAHKKEPILLLGVVSSVTIGLLVWWFGKEFGAIGAAASYLAVASGIVVWETLIWVQFRKRFHHQ